MSSAGSGSGSQSSVSGAATGNNNGAADAEADNGVFNPKYPLWAHASKVTTDETGRGGNSRFEKISIEATWSARIFFLC